MKYAESFEPVAASLVGAEESPAHDVRDGSVYVCTESTVLAVRVALATGRPLLIGGPPGSGKSSLAAYVARCMKWNYFEQVITSRTQAQDLQWTFDAVRRLRDATAGHDACMGAYVDPKVLWWAFDPKSACRRGFEAPGPGVRSADAPGELRGEDHPCVVLLDEIDKADPDVPNDLLVTLGSQSFRVAETGMRVEASRPPLVLITTNGERSLSAAFLRRCVFYALELPDAARLVKIAQAHFPKHSAAEELFDQLARTVVNMRESLDGPDAVAPSTAEYLDAVRACLELGVKPDDSALWAAIVSSVLEKQRRL